MTEIECTADRADADRPNILFTPPCACPKCAPPEIHESSDQYLWVTIEGRRVRFDLVNMQLGTTGQSLLGGSAPFRR